MLGEGGIVADLQRKEDLFESDPSFSLLFGRFIISKVANLAHTSVEHVMSRLSRSKGLICTRLMRLQSAIV